ncbi:thiol-disulfide oxidoreductase DCC family protein [Bacillus taeanensis]
MMTMTKPVLLFDGVCNLCNGIVQFVIKHDKKEHFLFASLQSEAGQQLLKQFALPTDDFNSFVYVKGDTYYTKSTAALFVVKRLSGLWQLLFAAMILPKPIRDKLYDLIAKNRYKLFRKRDTCMMPTPELKKRFLD